MNHPVRGGLDRHARRRKLWLAVAAVLAGSASLPAAAVRVAIALPLQADSPMVRSPAKAAVLAITHAGARLVAVGERGVVLLSDDDGRNWRQAQVPVSVTLTAASFPDPKTGWAVGHGGVVLHSVDGGQTWTKQTDGAALASVALEAANRVNERDPQLGAQLLKAARQLVDDGPDKPLLDVSFSSATSGVVVGAYGLAFSTRDGGKSWDALAERLGNPEGRHLNAVRLAGATCVLAGEQGLVRRSTDGLKSFSRLETPYKGSYFALQILPSGAIALGGIKGKVFVSDADGSTWRKLELPSPAAVTALSVGPDRSLLIATQNGRVYRRTADAAAVDPDPLVGPPMMTSIASTQDGARVLGSLAGVRRADGASNKAVAR